MQVEQVDFVSVPTRDVTRSVAFYGDVLGLPESEYAEGEVEGRT
jgi:catechol 2,3-dioxygenase-like lactoylglutathione lyase family enzyme